jgi:transcription initiation factor IIE alpha subunit
MNEDLEILLQLRRMVTQKLRNEIRKDVPNEGLLVTYSEMRLSLSDQIDAKRLLVKRTEMYRKT